MNHYEGMFLVPSTTANTELEQAVAQVEALIVKHSGQVDSTALWDERRLAYEIENHKRAGYLLCFFRMDGGGVDEFRRDLNYSEVVIRHLILARSQDLYEKGIALQKAASDAAEQEQSEEEASAAETTNSSAEGEGSVAESGGKEEATETVVADPPVTETEAKVATEEAPSASTS